MEIIYALDNNGALYNSDESALFQLLVWKYLFP